MYSTWLLLLLLLRQRGDTQTNRSTTQWLTVGILLAAQNDEGRQENVAEWEFYISQRSCSRVEWTALLDTSWCAHDQCSSSRSRQRAVGWRGVVALDGLRSPGDTHDIKNQHNWPHWLTDSETPTGRANQEKWTELQFGGNGKGRNIYSGCRWLCQLINCGGGNRNRFRVVVYNADWSSCISEEKRISLVLFAKGMRKGWFELILSFQLKEPLEKFYKLYI